MFLLSILVVIDSILQYCKNTKQSPLILVILNFINILLLLFKKELQYVLLLYLLIIFSFYVLTDKGIHKMNTEWRKIHNIEKNQYMNRMTFSTISLDEHKQSYLTPVSKWKDIIGWIGMSVGKKSTQVVYTVLLY